MSDSRSDYGDDRSEDGELQDDRPVRRGRGPQTPPEHPDEDYDSPSSRDEGTEDSLDIKPPQAARHKDKRNRRERDMKSTHKSDSHRSKDRYKSHERGSSSRHCPDWSIQARERRAREDLSRRGASGSGNSEMRHGHSGNPRGDLRDARQRIREREREREREKEHREQRDRELREREREERERERQERFERERRRERLMNAERDWERRERHKQDVETTIRRRPLRPEEKFRGQQRDRSRSPTPQNKREAEEKAEPEKPTKKRLSLRHLGFAHEDMTMVDEESEEEEEEALEVMASDQDGEISSGEEEASGDEGGSEVNAGSNQGSAASGTNSSRSDEENEEGKEEEEEEDDAKRDSSDKSKDSDSEGGSEDEETSDHEEAKTADNAVKSDTEPQINGKEMEPSKNDSSEVQEQVEAEPEIELPPYYPAIQGCRSVEEFHCLNRIEEGTYGVVYRARDKRTNDIVALKRLKMEREKEGFPITSLREVNTLLKSQHPNIVTVREIVVGSNMDKIYIVMDYVEHDLKSLMETMKHPFAVGEVKTLMIQLLHAVAHLHDNWIIHRDLKTSNLLLNHKGILKVGDFGLAREYGSPLKQYTPIVVTLWYRAPELLLGAKKYSTPIDMWSVGCIFGEFLTKKPLFPGKSEIDQLNHIYKDLGTPNETIWPGYNELPVVKKIAFANIPYNTLRGRFTFKRRNSTVTSFLSDAGFDLINKFLTYNPARRVSAEEALKHEYFTESPYPVEPSMFPTWPAKSELGHIRTTHSPKPPSGGKQYKQLGDADDELAKYGFYMNNPFPGQAVKGAGFNLKF